MDELKKEIIVFWGSQSGKSERLAKEFVRECNTRFGLAAMAADIDMFDFNQLATMTKGRYVGFVVATDGEGDPTDNAIGFCFGLGSSQYQSYNRFVDFVDEAISSAGGSRIAPVGKVDETLRSDQPWLSWKESVINDLAVRFGKVELEVVTGSSRPKISLVKSSNQESHDRADSHIAEHFSVKGKHQKRPQIVQINKIYSLSKDRLKVDSNLPTRQYLYVELDTKIQNGTLKYRTGDHLAIWPINPEHEVELMAEIFGWDDETLKEVVNLEVNSGIDDLESTIPVETPTTRNSILRYQLDICGPLFPEILSLMKIYCPTTEGKNYLESVMGRNECWEEIIAQHLTCAQIMRRAAPNEKWPEELFCALIQTLPKLRPRYYSIASSSVVNPESIALTVSVVQTRLPGPNGTFFGLATGYLRSFCGQNECQDILQTKPLDCSSYSHPNYNLDGPRSILAGRKVFAHVRSTPFNLPQSSDVPFIMFAAGSGIAPLRTFFQERLRLKKKGRDVGLMTLFFGCRSRDDLLYAELWEESVNVKNLKTHFAFPADPEKERKVYVQDLLSHDTGKEVAELILNQGAMVYICGSSNMARGVKGALDDILGGKASVAQLKELKRLHEDVWTS
ncbi:hypothetical protein N7540_002332 [Penicillium herquei]|nr:hypothetical protein N7540_002332 [Penicillium herquei]